MELIRQFTSELMDAVATAHYGEASTMRAAHLMAVAGEEQTGLLKHYSLTLQQNILTSTTYFDAGSTAYGNLGNSTYNNSTRTLITPGQMHLVSTLFTAGTPITMAEVLIHNSSIYNCTTVVHIGKNFYRTLTPGTLHCIGKYGSPFEKAVQADSTIHISDTDTCHSDCISIGSAHSKHQILKLGALPSIHPTLIREHIQRDGSPHYTAGSTQQTRSEQRQYEQHMEQIQQTMAELDQDTREDTFDTEHAHAASWASLAIGLAIAICALLLCTRCRGTILALNCSRKKSSHIGKLKVAKQKKRWQRIGPLPLGACGRWGEGPFYVWKLVLSAMKHWGPLLLAALGRQGEGPLSGLYK